MNKVDSPKTSPSVLARVASLPDLPMEDIKALWRELFEQEPPTHVRTFLERRLAYRLQEIDCQKTHAALLDRNRAHIEAIIDAEEQKKQSAKKRSPQLIPGTILTRLYQDKEHHVTVTHDRQFIFEGRLYQNLSVIAREITGTQWSGPLFFGVKKKNRQKGKNS